MSESWQQVAVWAMVALAAVMAVYSGISAWRAIRKGECGSCSHCASGADKQPAARPASERTVFLPADQLRMSIKARRR